MLFTTTYENILGLFSRQCQNGATMPEFDVAHIRQQNVDFITIPLDSSFRYKTAAQQQATTQALQAYATSAGLIGNSGSALRRRYRRQKIASLPG
jgi:hypothetical protein